MKLNFESETLIRNNHLPEIDVSPNLESVGATYYQLLTGILRWMLEIGWLDICL